MTAYRYDGTFAGFLTCAWDALERGIDPEAFLLPDGGASLWEVWEPATDREFPPRFRSLSPGGSSPACRTRNWPCSPSSAGGFGKGTGCGWISATR